MAVAAACHLPPVVDGVSSKEAIAESFRLNFEKNARPNNPQKVEVINMRFADEYVKLRETRGE